MFLVLSADESHIGRMNPSMLSDQQMIELFFTPDDFDVAHAHLGGSTSDACSWVGVGCADDGDETIEEIDWHSVDLILQGSLCFEMLPRDIRIVSLYEQALSGSVDISDLPVKLEVICVQKCFLSGTLDVGNLPHSLTQLHFLGNRITSLINLRDLPEGLEHFRVVEGHIEEKSIFVGKLPQGDFIVRLDGCGYTDVRLEDKSDSDRVKIE